jgi:hypothetical protein
MRRIKIGDKVQAFLNTRVIGIVKEIRKSDKVPWMVGGTASSEFICVLTLNDAQEVLYKMSDLHHYDE